MTFSDKIRYGTIMQKVAHKGEDSAMNYINILKIPQALSVSVGNNYSEYQLMHIFLDILHQGIKYISQIAIRQAELIKEEEYTIQKA